MIWSRGLVEQIRKILLDIVLWKVRRENEVGGAALTVIPNLETHPSVALTLHDDPSPEHIESHTPMRH
jgi:hypothetical protein